MSSWSNQTKPSVASVTNEAKIASTVFNVPKDGQGYAYDSYLTYDEALDPLSGNPVYYDTIGLPTSWTNEPKL